MWSSALLWALLGQARAAAPACEALDPSGFRDVSLLLRSGVDRGDDALVDAMIAELDTRIPCLTFAPEPHAWADILVLRAIAAYADGGDWQTPMAAALRIWPAVDRVVSSRHPLSSWEPPPVPGEGPLAHERARVYVDGLPTDRLPPPGVLSLVQRTDGTWWNSVVVGPDTPLPDGWEADHVVPAPHIATRASVAVGFAGIAPFQAPQFETDWIQDIGPGDRPGLAVGGRGDLITTFFSPFGVLVTGTGWASQQSPGLDLFASGVWAPRHLVLGVGGGTASVETIEGPRDGSPLAIQTGIEEIRRVYMLRYAVGVLRLDGGGDRLAWQVGLAGGGSANATRWSGDAELGLPHRAGRGRWLLAIGFASIEGRFEQVGSTAARTLTSGSARAWLSVGRAWGARS